MSELVSIYRFNPITLAYDGTTSGASIAHITLNDDDYTLTPTPEFDRDYSEIKYNPAADDWDIIALPTPLGNFIKRAIAEINLAFTSALRSNITLTAESAGLYQLKYAEAIKYIKASSPASLANYPFLKLESGALNVTAETVASNIITAHDAWNAKLLSIETIRQNAKAEINAVNIDDDAKTTITEISETAVDAILNLL